MVSNQCDSRPLTPVDGNGWSSRFHRLLLSGSVVLKSTIYPEFYSEWLTPWYHYIVSGRLPRAFRLYPATPSRQHVPLWTCSIVHLTPLSFPIRPARLALAHIAAPPSLVFGTLQHPLFLSRPPRPTKDESYGRRACPADRRKRREVREGALAVGGHAELYDAVVAGVSLEGSSYLDAWERRFRHDPVFWGGFAGVDFGLGAHFADTFG